MSKKSPKQAAVERVIPEQIKESAQQLWHVGKGAITRAHREGNRVFEALVREGETIRKSIKDRTLAVGDVSDVSARASDTWDKLEQVFEKRVARALSSLGVPTRADLARLNERLDALNAAVSKVGGTRQAKPASAKTAKPAAAKAARTPAKSATTARRAPTRKSAS